MWVLRLNLLAGVFWRSPQQSSALPTQHHEQRKGLLWLFPFKSLVFQVILTCNLNENTALKITGSDLSLAKLGWDFLTLKNKGWGVGFTWVHQLRTHLHSSTPMWTQHYAWIAMACNWTNCTSPKSQKQVLWDGCNAMATSLGVRLLNTIGRTFEETGIGWHCEFKNKGSSLFGDYIFLSSKLSGSLLVLYVCSHRNLGHDCSSQNREQRGPIPNLVAQLLYMHYKAAVHVSPTGLARSTYMLVYWYSYQLHVLMAFINFQVVHKVQVLA